MGAGGDALVVIAGVALIVAVGDSALRTFVLPRGVSSPLTRAVFQSLRSVFNLLARMTKSYEGQDRVMALYAPLGLFFLVGVWVVLVIGGYGLVYYGLVEVRGWREAFELSGSCSSRSASSFRLMTCRASSSSSPRPVSASRSWPS